MFTFKQFLESIDDPLDDDEKIDLHLLRHDKNHMMNPGDQVMALEKILKQNSTKITKPLYRGIAQEEMHEFKVGETFTSFTYSSFTEDKKVAESFSRMYKTNTVFELKAGSGFCYWRWLVQELEQLRKDDPQSFENNDGDWDIKSSIEEAEWVMPQKAKFKIVGITDGLIELEQV